MSRSVLLVIGSLGGGGAERQISDMANYWAAKGWNVCLATWSGTEVGDFYELDRRVRRVSVESAAAGLMTAPRVRANLRRIASLRRLLKSWRPEAVVSFMTQSNLLAIFAAVGMPTRVVVSERVHPALHREFPLPWRILRRIFYRAASVVVAQTDDAARWISKNCHAPVLVIPNALRSLPDTSELREKIIVGMGRLTHQKGFDLLIRAFSFLAPAFPDWRLAIVGEGAERENLRALAQELCVASRITFVGRTEATSEWMARAGLVVQPSRFEGFPNVILEAMGLGAAVISADCPSGPSEMIQDGVNGRLVPVDNVGELARVMRDLMLHPEERERLGQAARAVRQRYGQESVMCRWEACLFPQGSGTAGGNALLGKAG